ncbi:MAG: ribonuclease HII [Pelagibacterales bacterium]|nr:ribonuclease HII [Pelagibacterales bacterium]
MQEDKIYPNFLIENSFPNHAVAGIDEAGRGPLSGPVVAACVILDQTNYPKEINDSKKLSKTTRKKIYHFLKEEAKFGVGIVDENKIDEINILQATKLAMFLAYEDICKKYQIKPETLLVDGNFKPFNDNKIEIISIVKGDQKSLSIAAASIIAKETRDEIMLKLSQEFPQYGWDKNSGYPTKSHILAIEKFGICKYHRKTFEPIKTIINK